jgi:hypothetical protein
MPVVVDRGKADDALLMVDALLEVEKQHRAEKIQRAREGVLAWAVRNRRIDGQPFSLDRFPPLRGVYEDDHPHVCVIKPAQRGVSEWAINVVGFGLELGSRAWATAKDGINVAYIFPTQVALRDFSKERFSGLRSESAQLARLLSGDYDGVTFKQVGRSYLYLRGGWSEEALLSFAGDVLILDEYDRMDPKAVALARRRLNASVVRREIDISTPTVPGKGIHAQWLQSDRRVYEQTCPRCGAWQVYDFFRDVRVDGQDHAAWRTWDAERIRRAEVHLTCPSCRERLSDADRCREGRWVAQAPEVTSLRGYWIPWAPFPFVNLTAMAVSAVAQDPSEVQEFHRSDLGLPYSPTGGRVTEEMLARLSAELPGGVLPDAQWRATTMGVDVGSRFHYRVTCLAQPPPSPAGPWADQPELALLQPPPYVRAMGSVGTWQELDDLMARYGVLQCVVDALPEIHGARAFADRHRGRVLLATYPGPTALAGQLHRKHATEPTVQINRTAAMDRVFAAIAGAAERWPAAVHADREVIAHLTAPVRVTSPDEHGQERADWVHSSPDHLFHACVYDRIAREIFGAPPAMAGVDRPDPAEQRGRGGIFGGRR